MIPTTLYDVSVVTNQGKPFNFAIKEFLDSFIGNPSTLSLVDEPEMMEDPMERAYMAGVAEHLSQYLNGQAPEWSNDPHYFLSQPVVFGRNKSKVQCIVDTPTAFRRRLLFCGLTLTKLHSYNSK